VKPAAKPAAPSKKPAPAAKNAAPAAKKAAAAPAKQAAPAKSAAPKPAAPAKKLAPRADFGAPVDAFYAKPSPMQPILLAIRALVDQAVPDATSSLKWGQPFYELDGATVCAVGGHKAHVNLIFSGPPGTFTDPDGLLLGDGKTGRHLKLTTLDGLPRAQILGWLRTAARTA